MVAPIQPTARDAILQSIRLHLTETANLAYDHPRQIPVSQNQSHAPDNGNLSLVEIFCHRLESVGGRCIVTRNEDEASRALADIVANLQVVDDGKRIALSDAPLVSELARHVVAAEITVGPSASDLFSYGVGVTMAQAAIAETGTLILDAEKERHRLVSLLPPVHIAFVRSSNICGTIADALKHLRSEKELSRAVTFVTGPSRTADIELTLTVGVHGPKELYVIILAD